MPQKRLVVIDGYSLLFRAFFGTKYLSTSDGRPTNALFGFTSMIFYILENVRPDAIVVAMDAPGKTFRHAEFSEYKATRKETAPELVQQIPHAYELVKALGIPLVEAVGYEADDVVGTISRMAEENGYQTTIVSGDLDQLQLVDDAVSVLTTRIGVTDTVTYTPERVRERYGIEPHQLPDWKAIVGDTSDNIPGVPGIGEKGATALIQAHGSVEGICEALKKGEVDPKLAKKLTPEVCQQMLISKRLATIVRDAPIEYGFEPFRVTPEQTEAARSLMEVFEFRNHMKRMPQVLAPYTEGFATGEAPTIVLDEPIKSEVREEPDADKVWEWIGGRRYVLLFETTASQPSMFEEVSRASYIAIGNEVVKSTESAALIAFEREPGLVITHDAKPLFKRVPLTLDTVAFDSMLAGYVLQSGRSNYALRDLIQGYLDITPPTSMADMAACLYRLQGVLSDRLVKEGQDRVLFDIEQPLVPILAEMEMAGIGLDRSYLEEYSKELLVSIEDIANSIYEMAGTEFNIGSPKQLGEVLFEKLQIPGPKKTKTGWATGAEILISLAPSYPICAEILNWRELTKLKSTYADALPKMVASDGRVHTTFNQTVAATGRLSSNDPNLQNIPIRTELGRRIRKAFIPQSGWLLGSFDYSQIELRVLAHLCGEPALVEAFANKEDIHAATAALMFGDDIRSVSKEHRRYAKLLNFAVLYGVTDYGLANQLGGEFSVSEARMLIQQYYERFPQIKSFMESIVAEARSKGFTTTICGRRRYFPEIHAANRNERLYAERQAMNAPMQGAAADMIKLAMIDVRKKVSPDSARLLLQVHDELVFELPKEDRELIETIRETMERSVPLRVPVDVDAKVGRNWLEMEAVSSA